MSDKILPGTFVLRVLLIFYIAVIDFPSRFVISGYKFSAILTLVISISVFFLYFNAFLYISKRVSPNPDLVRNRGFGYILFFSIFVILANGLLRSNFNINTQQNSACYIIIFSSFFLGTYLSYTQDFSSFCNWVQSAALFSSILYIFTCLKFGAGNSFIYFPRAISMISCLGLAVSFLLTHQNKNYRFLVQVVCFTAVVLSLSRTAIIAAFSTFLLLAILNLRRRFLVSILTVCTFIILANVFFSFSLIRDRFGYAGDQASFAGVRLNTAGRAKIWSLLLSEGKNSFFLGHGIGSSEDLVLRNFQTIAQPHNDFLRIYFDLGFFGFLSLCTALLYLAVSGWRIHRFDSEGVLIFKMKFVLVFHLILLMLTDNPLVYPFYTLPLFLILGVLFGESKIQKKFVVSST
jgi:O-antigen ligase